MRELTEIEKRAQIAVSKLRKATLQKGESFMIYSNDLPEGMYYMEYPDGKMKIVTASHKLKDFVVEKELLPKQAALIRSRINAQ